MSSVDPTSDPGDDELAERGRALIAAAVSGTQAPMGLRERIEADRARVHGGSRRRWWSVLVPAGGLVAAAIVAVVLATGGGPSPSVLATAQLAARGPILPAPKEDPANPALLKRDVDGVPFPYWGDDFPWEAVGARDGTVEGRPTQTVYYENPAGARVAYTIVSGDALGAPDGARARTVNGVDLQITEDGAKRIVTWQRKGHTCVLTAPRTVPEAKLVALAAWKDKGNVPF
jgi:uncharacterized iron-regulated membrane protein